jgi:aryl-alcohol dehydrogenase-like predicted oxidoreductase
MNFLRPLAGTDLTVSALGLGTVKLGRNQQVKYPGGAFQLPDDRAVRKLLALARELGINFIDTAPAYGTSETRLGELLENRKDWVLCTKVGEEFENGASHFDFSAAHTRFSIERSLTRLRTDCLDLVLIHSDGNDEAILRDGACVDELRRCQREGLLRHIGMSTKTIAGGVLAAELLDVVMLTWNLQQRDEAVLRTAERLGKGVLVKKGLMSGHVQGGSGDLVRDSMQLIFAETGIGSMITGTINPAHLRSNVNTVRAVIADQVP